MPYLRFYLFSSFDTQTQHGLNLFLYFDIN